MLAADRNHISSTRILYDEKQPNRLLVKTRRESGNKTYVKEEKTTQYYKHKHKHKHKTALAYSTNTHKLGSKLLATYRQPLAVIVGAGRKQGVQRVVGGHDEAGQVGQQLAAEVEQNQEQVQRHRSDGAVGLGDARGLFDVDDGGVLGEL